MGRVALKYESISLLSIKIAKSPTTTVIQKITEYTASSLAVAGVVFQHYAMFFVLVPVISGAAYTIIYSYPEYQKEIGKRINQEG